MQHVRGRDRRGVGAIDFHLRMVCQVLTDACQVDTNRQTVDPGMPDLPTGDSGG